MKHLITPHATISYVADGIAIGGVEAYREDLGRFSLLLNVAEEVALVGGLPARVLHARLDDQNDPALVLRQAPEVLRAVALVAAAHQAGKQVLVTCAQGRNRSALVVAQYLVQCGNRPRDVVDKIRARRANALTNKAFVAWLGRKPSPMQRATR